jgi:glycosyltransferase involved in cell wall biosynthesis
MLLTYPYRPDPRLFRESRSLIRHGIDVQLIAWDREGSHPKQAEEDGVRVIRVGPRCPYRSALRVLARLPRFWFRALRASRSLEFDLVHCHDLDTLPIGLLIGRIRGKAVLYDAHDLYSGMVQSEIGGAARVLWLLEGWLSRRPDELVTVNELMAEKLSAGRKRPARIVTNSPDTGILEGHSVEDVRERYELRGFVVSYLGSLEPGRFVQELVDSAQPSGKLMLVMAGNGTMRSIVERASLHNPSLKFLGTLSTDEALRVTWASDLVVAMLDPSNPNYRNSTPVKVLDAMACGRPVVTAEGLEISKKVKEVGCGFVIPYDKSAFVGILEEAMASPERLREMGQKGKEHFEKELSWERSRDELLKAYKALLPPSRD